MIISFNMFMFIQHLHRNAHEIEVFSAFKKYKWFFIVAGYKPFGRHITHVPFSILGSFAHPSFALLSLFTLDVNNKLHHLARNFSTPFLLYRSDTAGILPLFLCILYATCTSSGDNLWVNDKQIRFRNEDSQSVFCPCLWIRKKKITKILEFKNRCDFWLGKVIINDSFYYSYYARSVVRNSSIFEKIIFNRLIRSNCSHDGRILPFVVSSVVVKVKQSLYCKMLCKWFTANYTKCNFSINDPLVFYCKTTDVEILWVEWLWYGKTKWKMLVFNVWFLIFFFDVPRSAPTIYFFQPSSATTELHL